MTRSTEDLSRDRDCQPSSSNEASNSPRLRKSHQSQAESIERSPSCYHVPVNHNRHTIIMPKNYNPMSQLTALENLESFKLKTFHENDTVIEKKISVRNVELKPKIKSFQCTEEDTFGFSGFTNRIFSESYEAGLVKDSKMMLNLQQKRLLQKQAKKTFKQMTLENRIKDLQLIGVLIMEIFLPGKLRAHGSCSDLKYDHRVEVCKSLLANDIRSIPACVQYPLQLLFGMLDTYRNEKWPLITDKGLPMPNAELLLEPILSQTLFPFPVHYFRVYSVMKMLYNFNNVGKMLDIYTFYECDGQCQKYETLDKTRTAFSRKLAECMVRSCVSLVESLLTTTGQEIFTPVQLLLPHVIDLVNEDETSILAAWYLFDIIATALGPKDTRKYLLQPILSLYEAENGDRRNSLQKYDPLRRFSSSNVFKSRKAVKLYHHSFLLKLIVRFGLDCFLTNFVTPLIEAVGGYKDPQINLPYHTHHRRSSNIGPSRSMNKNLRFDSTDKRDSIMTPDESDEKTLSALSPSMLNMPSTSTAGDVFVFESESPNPANDDTDPEANNAAIQKILEQLDIKSETGSFDLKLNYSSAFEVTEDGSVDNLSHESVEDDDAGETVTKFTIGSIEANVQSPTIPIPR